MSSAISAAGSLQWYRDSLASGVPFDDLVAGAADVSPGSEGLLFLPYLTGERTPHPDPLARGAWEGAAYGAALLAAVGVGLHNTVEEACHARIQVTGRSQPGPATAAYADLYPLFQGLYPALRDEFKAIGAWVAAT